MPIANLEVLLRDLSFLLPDVSMKDVDVGKLMKFDLHNLQDQFQTDLIYASFFSMLAVEVRHLLRKKENSLQDLENRLAEEMRETIAGKTSDTKIKQAVQRDPNWIVLRDAITQLEYQVASVETLVSDLHRKGIALNVITAKTRAEIGAAISH